MKILVFLQGTLIMHKNGVGKTREERVQQSKQREESVLDYASYVPVGNAVNKLKRWQTQGAKISYLSSHENLEDIRKDRFALKRYGFPKGTVYYRRDREAYAQVAEKIMPDVLIEDDCESIGGELEMTYSHIKPELRTRIKSVVVKEFNGIDSLPENLSELLGK